MNKRQAMRYASGRVATAAYGMAEETGSASLPLGDQDRERVANALLLIANRLEDASEGRRGRRQAKQAPPDPNQAALFE